ncbi:hypothetical protein MRX96_034006 [Rhipicephalus microplus]
MITAALCHVLLSLVQTLCTVSPMEHDMHRGANRACAIILPLPKTDCRSAWLGFAGGTHIDILLVDPPAFMGFRIERHTVKFANYNTAVTIATALWAWWLRHNAVF